MKYLIDLDTLPEFGKPLKIPVSRRGLLSAAADAAKEKRRSSAGKPSYKIENLSAYSAEELDKLKPVVSPKARIRLDGNIVFAETSASVDPIPLFPVESPALVIFNQFNGLQMMSEIFVKVRNQTGWNEEKTREKVLGEFLRLCEVRVCEPGNALE